MLALQLIFLVFIGSALSFSSLIGEWESVNGAACFINVNIGVNTFKQYADGDCALDEYLIGSYYVSDEMIVVRVSVPEMNLPSLLFYYELNDGLLSLFDKNRVLIDVLERNEEVHLLNGVWDGEMVTTLALVSNSFQGRGYFHQRDLYYYYESKRDFGRIREWSFDDVSGSGTLKNTYFGAANFYSYQEQTVTGDSSFVISGNTLLGLTTSKVKLNSKRSNDVLNGHYYYLDSTPCNHYLELVDGFYVEVISGNTNCDNCAVLYGSYDIIDDSHVSMKIGSAEQTTVQYNKTEGLILNNIEYVVAVQQVVNLTITTFEYDTNILSTLFALLSGALTELTGLSIDPNSYDIIDTGTTLFKRSKAEAELVIQSPYNQDNGDGEVISSSSSDVIVLPDSSTTTSISNSISGSSTTSSNSGSDTSSSASGSISSQDPSSVETKTSGNTISGDQIHIGAPFQGKLDFLVIVLAVLAVLIVVTTSAIVYFKFFLQDTR